MRVASLGEDLRSDIPRTLPQAAFDARERDLAQCITNEAAMNSNGSTYARAEIIFYHFMKEFSRKEIA